MTKCRIDRVERDRNIAIGSVITKLQKLLDEYRSPNYICWALGGSFECGSILYGALAKGMDSLGVLLPSKNATFSRLSIQEFCSAALNMRSPRWCGGGSGGLGVHNSNHLCNITERIRLIVNDVQDKITGFQLSHFERIQSSAAS